MSADPFQVQFHPKLGVVIYDPVAQMGLAKEQMRLFKIGSMSDDFHAGHREQGSGAMPDEQAPKCARGFVSRGSRWTPQTVLRALSPTFRFGGFRGLQGLQRDSLHVWHLQLRFEFASAQSGVFYEPRNCAPTTDPAAGTRASPAPAPAF